VSARVREAGEGSRGGAGAREREAAAPVARSGERISPLGSWAVVGVLFVLVAITLPELGSDPWRFRPGSVDPQGPLAPLVRAAGEEWDLGIPRAAAFLAALLCGATAVYLLAARSPSGASRSRAASADAAGDRTRGGLPRWAAVALILAVGILLTAPATLLQLGLRDSTAPWFFTNDSTYQAELGGELLLDLDNPYGHDYRESGLERFYTRNGSVSERVREREVALEHFAYFPGSVVTAAAWRLLPGPFDDYRLLVLFCNLGMLAAALAFRGPLAARLALGALLVCNPIAVRSAWFGQNDAPSLLLLVLAFALASRRRFGWAAAVLGGAVLLKQFALVAAPFLALMIVRESGALGDSRSGALRSAARRRVAFDALRRPTLAFAGVLAAGILPFFVVDPVAFYEDTIKYGAGTYRIVGYGLSAILVEVGVVEDRDGAYPFALLALLTWVPLTAWLLLVQRRSAEAWVGAAAFSVSILWLMFIGRTFNNYYLVWPMTGAVAAALTAVASQRAPDRPEPG
jgi:multisubunit Na+/H+ antiporter MnhG subunit